VCLCKVVMISSYPLIFRTYQADSHLASARPWHDGKGLCTGSLAMSVSTHQECAEI
jgi:hypothetical protein